MNSLLNPEIISLSIAQNITERGTKLTAIKKKIPFVEVMNLMINSIAILTSDVNTVLDGVIPPQKIQKIEQKMMEVKWDLK